MMGNSGLVLVLGLAFLLTVESLQQIVPHKCEVPLRTDAGWVCGRVRDAEDGTKYASFRAVPYAKPPLGIRRFKELEPLDPWAGFLDATEDGTACPQKDFVYNRMTRLLRGMSEDCIHLNLHVPYHVFSTILDGDQKVGVPIMVFVHGGAFQVGSSLTDLHGPEYLLTKDIAVITFNFRIGILGFLSLDTEEIPGNQGLRDVITLLRWVQRNAKSFGGNPDDVTLIGHSTGASIAHLVSLSKAADGLIHKVALMSGTALVGSLASDLKHATYMAEEFLRALDINSTDKHYIAQRLYYEPILNILYAANVVQLTADLENMLPFVPVVESIFPNVTRIIDDDPFILIAKGRGKQYPLLNGFTTSEYHYFKWILMASNPMSRVQDKPTLLLPGYMIYSLSKDRQLQLANQISHRYFNNSTPTLDQMLDYLSDIIFVYYALKVSQWRAMDGAPVYTYQFSYEGLHSIVKEALWLKYKGVAHVEDLTYVFRVTAMLDQSEKAFPPKNTDDSMRDWMSSIIANFVRCSNPTCKADDNRWPATSTALQYQDIREPMTYRMTNLTVYQKGIIDFLDGIDEKSRMVQESFQELQRRKSSKYHEND